MKAVLIAILLSAGSFQFDFSECETLPGTTKEPTSVAHKPESPNSSWYFENQHLNSAIKTPLGFEAIIIVNHGADPIIKNTIVKRKERSKIQSSTVLIQEEFDELREALESDDLAAVAKELARFPNCKEIVWLQEEPENMGSWNSVKGRLYEAHGDTHEITRVSRTESGSPATGVHAIHVQEQDELFQRILDGL